MINIEYIKLKIKEITKKPNNGVKKYEPPHGVVPKGGKSAIAEDSCALSAYNAYNDLQFFSTFMGYPQLSALAQSSDYRMVGETTAQEMTRAWGKIVGCDDAEKIKQLEDEFERLDVREIFRKHILNESIFGLSHIFIDVGAVDTSIRLIPSNVKKGSLKRIGLIEAIHTTPSFYNANDATADDFYKVSNWFALGKNIHQDRLLTLVMRPVPDMLKPAYNFGGASMIQLMHPYVQRWQRTVDSVSDLIKAFSITALKTDMSNLLAGGEDGVSELQKRLALFDEIRDNLNLMALNSGNGDSGGEDLVQINTPLSGLDTLVTKAQEQMSMPSHTPLVKLTGITPSGLNASSDGEIQVYYDWIMSLLNAHILPQLKRLLEVAQMSLFGEIDESIVFQFNSLTQMSDKEKSEIEINRSTALGNNVANGLISQEEARQTLVDDENLPYQNIDASDLSGLLDREEEAL